MKQTDGRSEERKSVKPAFEEKKESRPPDGAAAGDGEKQFFEKLDDIDKAIIEGERSEVVAGDGEDVLLSDRYHSMLKALERSEKADCVEAGEAEPDGDELPEGVVRRGGILTVDCVFYHWIPLIYGCGCGHNGPYYGNECSLLARGKCNMRHPRPDMSEYLVDNTEDGKAAEPAGTVPELKAETLEAMIKMQLEAGLTWAQKSLMAQIDNISRGERLMICTRPRGYMDLRSMTHGGIIRDDLCAEKPSEIAESGLAPCIPDLDYSAPPFNYVGPAVPEDRENIISSGLNHATFKGKDGQLYNLSFSGQGKINYLELDEVQNLISKLSKGEMQLTMGMNDNPVYDDINVYINDFMGIGWMTDTHGHRVFRAPKHYYDSRIKTMADIDKYPTRHSLGENTAKPQIAEPQIAEPQIAESWFARLKKRISFILKRKAV